MGRIYFGSCSCHFPNHFEMSGIIRSTSHKSGRNKQMGSTGCSTLTLLLICSSFSRENGHPFLICSSLSTASDFFSYLESQGSHPQCKPPTTKTWEQNMHKPKENLNSSTPYHQFCFRNIPGTTQESDQSTPNISHLFQST